MQNKAVFSYACGKVILVGEHAVVYGSQAIGLPIEQGLRVAIYKLEQTILEQKKGPMLRGLGLFSGDLFFGDKSFGPAIFYEVLDYLVSSFGEKIKDLAIVLEMEILPSRGLGSSAALSVALIKAIYQYFELDLTQTKLFEHTTYLETLFHSRPSGIDHSVIIKNKPIGFKKINTELTSWPIELELGLTLVVGTMGPHIGTKNAVAKLACRMSSNQKSYERIFAEINELAKDMEKALVLGQKTVVGELMNFSQGYLNALGVSCAILENLCFIARNTGALGAKLTGAGSGGAVIALADGNEEDIHKAFIAGGYQSFITRIAATK